MRKERIFVLLAKACGVGLLQTSLFVSSAQPAKHTDLDVRWAARTNPWPARLWAYKVEPNTFSPAAISNLLLLTGFTTNDKADYGSNGMLFSSSKVPGTLRVSFPESTIQYYVTLDYGPNKLAKNLPDEKKLMQLTTNFLSIVGIDIKELLRKKETDEPDIRFFQQPTLYFANSTTITNVPYREANFTRSLDGVRFIGYDRGGDGEVAFGERGRVCKIRLSWSKVTRDKQFRTVTPDWIVKWIRGGNVVPGRLRGKAGPVIDQWGEVKTITIKEAWACCRGEDYSTHLKPVFPTTLTPFACLLAKVETPDISTEVLIDCPIVDESKEAPPTKSP